MTLNGLWSANNTIFDTAILYKAHNLSSGSITTSTSSTSSTSSSSSSTAFSSVSLVSPSTTINIATTTTSAVYSTYTNFNGLGHLLIYTGGLLQGDIGSAGTWYNTPGQSTATYTAVPLYGNGTAFLLQHSTVYCSINSDFSFGCAATAASGASVFGQTPDGNLTYNGSPAFYASSAASSGAKPTVYVTSLPVSMNIVWNALATATTSASVSSTVSSQSLQTSTSSQGSQTSSSSQILSTSSSASLPISTTSSSISPSVAAPSVVTITQIQVGVPTTIVSTVNIPTTVDLSFTNTVTTVSWLQEVLEVILN